MDDSPTVARSPEEAAPSFEDVITSAVQEALDAEEEPGHIVVEWALVADVIGPDGKTFNHIRYSSDEIVYSRAFGLFKYGMAMVDRDLAEDRGDE